MTLAFTTPVKFWNVGDTLVKADTDAYITNNTQWLYTNGLYLIAEQVLAASASSVTFSSIPGTWRHLQIHWQARGDNGASFVNLCLQFNGDTGTNYNSQTLSGGGTGAAGSQLIATASPKIGTVLAASATVGRAASGVIQVPNYSGATFQKNAVCTAFLNYDDVSGDASAEIDGVLWKNASAVTTVKIFAQTGNLITGSTFSLVGCP